ncbi:hypothetical protein FRIGORI9N_280010 [Frigoribacterium sp. 9N]|nr:hypothetical protein FRIGORI9N_280010 [Frigoribacterium sp. 9N]
MVSDGIADHRVTAFGPQMWVFRSVQGHYPLLAKEPGLTSKTGPPMHDDLVLRPFSVDQANQLSLAQITERRTDDDKLYLSRSGKSIRVGDLAGVQEPSETRTPVLA